MKHRHVIGLLAMALVLVAVPPAQADHASEVRWLRAPWVATDCANVDCGAVLNAGNAWTQAGFKPGFLGTAWTGCDMRISVIVICADDADGYAGRAYYAWDSNNVLQWAVIHLRSDWAAWPTDSEEQCMITHELGHAIGLLHSADPNSVMNPLCDYDRPFPNNHDAEAISSMYG